MRHVLVIDDEQMVRDMLQKALSQVHFDVDTAESAYSGIEKLNRKKFDLVITDIHMPEMDGNEVARYIKNSNSATTPVVGVTGSPWMVHGDLFDDVLLKPFSIRTLIETARSLTALQKAS